MKRTVTKSPKAPTAKIAPKIKHKSGYSSVSSVVRGAGSTPKKTR